MEFSKRQRLITAWDTMEDDGCCCGCCCCGGGGGGEAGLARPNTAVQLRQKEQRLRRMVRFLVAALVVLISAALVLLLMLVFGVQKSDSQHVKESGSPSPGASDKQQQLHYVEKPSAMLTAPYANYAGSYLQWHSEDGIAYCRGGFNYSDGNLVVPTAGIYRVFLQITYEKNDPPSNGELMLYSEVYAFAGSYMAEKPVLRSFDTVSCSMGSWKKSLYTSGLLELEAKATLRTKSSYPKLIVQKEDLVFFGAELVSNSK